MCCSLFGAAASAFLLIARRVLWSVSTVTCYPYVYVSLLSKEWTNNNSFSIWAYTFFVSVMALEAYFPIFWLASNCIISFFEADKMQNWRSCQQFPSASQRNPAFERSSQWNSFPSFSSSRNTAVVSMKLGQNLTRNIANLNNSCNLGLYCGT